MQQDPWEAPYALVYIDPDDDIATVCGKIDTAPHHQVALAAPRGNKALASLLGMTILRHHAEAAGREIAVVSPKGRLRSRARRQGLRAFRSPRWVTFARKPAARLRLSLGSTAIPFPAYRTLCRAALRALAVVAILIPAYLFIPSATIIVHPQGRLVSQTLAVTASRAVSSVDYATMIVPSHFTDVPLELTMALVTTGKVTVPTASAKGSVLFTNQNKAALTIPGGTEVASEAGAAFLTQEEATLAAGEGKQVEVAVAAKEPGSKGNVRARDITLVRGTLSAQILVTNPAPIAGGADKEAQGVVAQDLEQLRALLMELMRERGVKALSQREEGALLVYPQTARVLLDEAIFSHKVGEATQWVTVTATGRVRVLTIEQEHLRTLARRRLAGASSASQGIWVLDGSFRVTSNSLQRFDDEQAQMTVTTEMEVVDGLSEKEIIRHLRGRSASSAKAYLSEHLQLRQPPVIDITPGWGFGIPRFDWRINLAVEGPLKRPQPAGVEKEKPLEIQSPARGS